MLVLVLIVFLLLCGGVGALFGYLHIKKLRRAKDIERSLKMVPLLVRLPAAETDQATGRDERQANEENIARAEGVFNLLSGIAKKDSDFIYGQKYMSIEIIAKAHQILFYLAVPASVLSVAEKALMSGYPDIQIEKVEDYNIFSLEGKIHTVAGGELDLSKESFYPINQYKMIDFDPLSGIITSMSKLTEHDGAAIQILVRPAKSKWNENARNFAKDLLDPSKKSKKPSKIALEIAKAPFTSPQDESEKKQSNPNEITSIEQKSSQLVEEKSAKPAFETLIRVVASSENLQNSKLILQDILSGFTQFNLPGSNGFAFSEVESKKIATDFIFRFFPVEKNKNVLNTSELATVFHLPREEGTSATPVERTAVREVSAPSNLSLEGVSLGKNMFRGTATPVKLTDADRRRHMYIIGQTGTGKSTLLQNLVVQDMAMGKGLALVDPHGDLAEAILAKVPPNRIADVVYFNPGDMEVPLGLNLFEFDQNHPEQKDFIVQETINMLYKLYDPGHTGIIGPRYEHWFRNAALTLMSDPNGATFIQIPKVFTDNDYLKQKFKYVKDPTVSDFWTKEMAQTSDFHKSEVLGWFVSKFGAFMSNEMMRNIIGQINSAFDFRDIMDSGKILIVNLSKGSTGELNSNLLGMIFVMKVLAASLSRSDMPEEQRRDFTMYVDEFQNFSTDSFATILSEARKYRLNLIVANQFIGQLTDEIRDAVFGNVGSLLSFRVGPEDADFLIKQFEPNFDANDLVNLPNGSAALKLMSNGLPTTPFSLQIDYPTLGTANPKVAEAVKQYCRNKFGKPKEIIEKEVYDSLKTLSTTPKTADSSGPMINS